MESALSQCKSFCEEDINLLPVFSLLSMAHWKICFFGAVPHLVADMAQSSLQKKAQPHRVTTPLTFSRSCHRPHPYPRPKTSQHTLSPILGHIQRKNDHNCNTSCWRCLAESTLGSNIRCQVFRTGRGCGRFEHGDVSNNTEKAAGSPNSS